MVGDQEDEHEYEISATSGRSINWRRVELVKEKMLLEKELSEKDNWNY